MSAPPNIEVFNVVAAKVLVELYEAFPTPTNINPTVLGIGVLLEEKYEEGSPQYQHLLTAADSTVQFLIDEGFVRVSDGPQYLEVRGFQNLVLTTKGFALLQKTPESVDPSADRRSYFERLKSVTAAGAQIAAREAIGPLVARMLGAV